MRGAGWSVCCPPRDRQRPGASAPAKPQTAGVRANAVNKNFQKECPFSRALESPLGSNARNGVCGRNCLNLRRRRFPSVCKHAQNLSGCESRSRLAGLWFVIFRPPRPGTSSHPRTSGCAFARLSGRASAPSMHQNAGTSEQRQEVASRGSKQRVGRSQTTFFATSCLLNSQIAASGYSSRSPAPKT